MTAAENSSFDNDKPIADAQKDLFGFGYIAEKLATSVLSMGAKEGFVIGIEGAWGSGKSSLMNLLMQQVKAHKDATVINFAPWLVGDRHELISGLMSDLASELDRLQASKDPAFKARSGGKDLAAKLRTYGVRAGKGLSPLLQLGALALPGLGAIATGVEYGTKVLESVEGGQTPMPKLKAEIADLLAKLGRRFVVVIDDLDRLEPKEAAEILRLVRAVGDFPNVVYLMCYDRTILAASINHALQITDGERYLQKIVQATYAIPQPEDTELRHWLFEEARNFYRDVTGSNLSDDGLGELEQAVFSRGELLRTPRDVVQVMNGLRLIYPAVHQDVNFADMCWLQIVRVMQRPLYEWIENYLTQFSVVAQGDGHVDAAEIRILDQNLMSLLPDEGCNNRGIWGIADRLLGVRGGSVREKESHIFNSVEYTEIAAFEDNKRLSSPVHYRYYFSFRPAQNAFNDQQMREVFRLAETADGTLVSHLRSLYETPRRYGGTWFAQFQQRLLRRGFDGLSHTQIFNLMSGIATVIDAAETAEPERGLSGSQQAWKGARRLLKNALHGLSTGDRSHLFRHIVAAAPSLGWLVDEVIGGDLWRHGRVGDRAYDETRAVFSQNELDSALGTIRARLNEPASWRYLLNAPHLLGVMYRWKDIVGENPDVQIWIGEMQKNDADFLQMLWGMRGWSMSDRIYYPLNRRDVAAFMEYDATIDRLKEIAGRADSYSGKAQSLLEAAEIGRRD